MADHERSLEARPTLAGVLGVALTLLLASWAFTSCAGSSDSIDTAAPASATAVPPSSPTSTPGSTAVPAATASPDPTATAAPAPTPAATAAPEPTPALERPTIDELLARDVPLNLAHAGGDQDAPHSTMYAFKQAVAAGADVLEIDVQLSSDGVVVVHHDATVDGNTGATGSVIDFTVAELQALDNAYWFADECWPCRDLDDEAYLYRGVRTGDTPPPTGFDADDFRIVTMRELVEQFPLMPFDIEIKGDVPQALDVAEALAEELSSLGIQEHVVVVSFLDEVVAAFKEAAPTVETSPGTDELTFWFLADVPISGSRILQVPPFFDGIEVVNEELIRRAGEAGLDVWVWPNDAATQENVDYYRELIALGVDGVIAGRPAAMEAARN